MIGAAFDFSLTPVSALTCSGGASSGVFISAACHSERSRGISYYKEIGERCLDPLDVTKSVLVARVCFAPC
jgi:hypothetical protein